jgi:hypothetical protein
LDGDRACIKQQVSRVEFDPNIFLQLKENTNNENNKLNLPSPSPFLNHHRQTIERQRKTNNNKRSNDKKHQLE